MLARWQTFSVLIAKIEVKKKNKKNQELMFVGKMFFFFFLQISGNTKERHCSVAFPLATAVPNPTSNPAVAAITGWIADASSIP
jgi:hypothetical protein